MESGLSGITQTFSKKLGPLQVWMWAAILLGAYLLYAFMKKSGPFAAAKPLAPIGSASDGSSIYSPTATDTNPSGGLVGNLAPRGIGGGPGLPGGAASTFPWGGNSTPGVVPWVTPVSSGTSAGTGAISSAGQTYSAPAGGANYLRDPVTGSIFYATYLTPDAWVASKATGFTDVPIPGNFPGLRR